MSDTIDLLKIKIEQAKMNLPEETANAIAKVDWQKAIFDLRNKTKYTIEQFGDLELETELVLCGLTRPEDYAKEVENRLHISKEEARKLVEEVNNSIFKKIREEVVKNIDRKQAFQKNSSVMSQAQEINNGASTQYREQIVKENTIPLPGLNSAIQPPIGMNIIMTQKLSTPTQTPAVETEHTIENMTKKVNTYIPHAPKVYAKNADPYRMSPDE